MTEAPSDTLPFGLITELQKVAPRLTLVGSFVRDYWAVHVAGLPFIAGTIDVDVAILVDSMADYRERLRALDGPTGTGLVFHVNGFQVDVIPYGPMTVDGIIEPTPGVTLDVTGMAEAARHAVTITSGPHRLAVATLAHMIALKVVAWGYRGETEPKDARDLGPLLEATTVGPFGEALWRDEVAGARWEYDNVRMGPYRAAREVAATWEPSSLARLLSHLTLERRDALASRIARSNGGRAEHRLLQLEAFAHGLTDPPS